MNEGRSIQEEFLLEFIQKCKEFGLKITPQRMAIYKEVLNSGNHPSAEVIYKRVKQSHPAISFDTVNRTLLTFAEIGLLEIVEGSGDVRRFDPNTKNHHHFRCRNCGKIVDFYYDKYNNLEVPEQIKKKFDIKKIRVILDGICDECKKEI
ncbi:MAG: transcriptional repressor [Thermodesulfovibrio sp.]|nr:transcriptional repressor [Thermodesulfovibrio sp.]